MVAAYYLNNHPWVNGTSAGGYPYWAATASATTTVNITIGSASSTGLVLRDILSDWDDHGRLQVLLGEERTINLPDGSVIHVSRDGNFHVDDANAEVVYRANRHREFNRFVNASDILEEFVTFAGQAGVTKAEFLKLPLETFLRFLILRAAEADGEEPPEEAKAPLLALPAPKVLRHHCRTCGRFVRAHYHARQFDYCDGTCASRFALRLED